MWLCTTHQRCITIGSPILESYLDQPPTPRTDPTPWRQRQRQRRRRQPTRLLQQTKLETPGVCFLYAFYFFITLLIYLLWLTDRQGIWNTTTPGTTIGLHCHCHRTIQGQRWPQRWSTTTRTYCAKEGDAIQRETQKMAQETLSMTSLGR